MKERLNEPTPGAASSFNRRKFLGGGLAAASLPLIPSLPAAAAGASAPSPTPPAVITRKIKVGLVGAGGRGLWIAKLFQKHGGYDFHAVADYFQQVADTAGDALGTDKARRFSGLSAYKKVIESGVEAIILETPPYFFPEHARAAVEAGLHVYMAKPVAVDVPGCLEIQASAAKATAAKKVFLVDYQLPTEPHNIEVVRLVNAGEIGKVVALHTHYFAGPFADPPFTDSLESRLRGLIWCNDVAIGGGYHVNACIHAVDPALWLTGQRPVACLGLSRIGRPNPHGDSHDVFELLFEYENGVIHSHRGEHVNNYLGFDVVCQIVGESGHAQICYGGRTSLKGREYVFNQEISNPYEPGAVRNIARFYECVTQGNTTNDTVQRSVDGALATILGREAGMRRARVTLAEVLKENKRLTVDLKGLRS